MSRDDASPGGPDPALLLTLLRRSAETAPDRLGDLLREVLEPAGFRSVELRLVDQRCLWLLPVSASGSGSTAVAIEGTRPGDAFREQRPVVDGERVWLPVTETAERLGVLGVDPPGPVEGAIVFCEHLAHLTGQLLHTRGRYTDTYLRFRRREPMELAAELQWTMLPPLDFATPSVVVAAAIEPAYDVGGDAFDYSLDGDILHFALFDAMGHGLEAATISALALGAYRNGRRAGRSMVEVMQQVDDVLFGHFGGDRFVTGQIGRLDTAGGRLTWLNAGHPQPLLVRAGVAVEAIEAPPRIPLGLGPDPVVEAEAVMGPGDRLLLHSDGVVEGRDASGSPFGVERLRELVTGNPGADLHELAAILVAASLEHQGGETRDDATVMLLAQRAGLPD